MRYLFLVIILMTMAFSAYSEDKTENIEPLMLTSKVKDLEADLIKADKGLCIGDKCKEKWPSLKCAEYANRPKGESPDEYCQSLGQACTAVVLSGSGTAYFNECSSIPITSHKTRCCWVE